MFSELRKEDEAAQGAVMTPPGPQGPLGVTAIGTDGKKVKNYFGSCPECGNTDGYINVGHDHWFICKTHQTKWYVGTKLFSSCLYETPEEQRREQEALGFDSFCEVEPIGYGG